METQRLRAIAHEVFKNLKNVYPKFMKEIFYHSSNVTHRKKISKHDKVLKQKTEVTWGAHMEVIAWKHSVYNIAIQAQRYYEKVVLLVNGVCC